MKLISLPDALPLRPKLTLGKDYQILGRFSNGYIIELDDKSDKIIIWEERLSNG